jgi:hypothetical protein
MNIKTLPLTLSLFLLVACNEPKAPDTHEIVEKTTFIQAVSHINDVLELNETGDYDEKWLKDRIKGAIMLEISDSLDSIAYYSSSYPALRKYKVNGLTRKEYLMYRMHVSKFMLKKHY